MGASAALVATEGGSEGAKSAAAPAPATPAAIMPPARDDGAGGGPASWDGVIAEGGAMVCACPFWSVIVTTLVVLLITTELWMFW